MTSIHYAYNALHVKESKLSNESATSCDVSWLQYAIKHTFTIKKSFRYTNYYYRSGNELFRISIFTVPPQVTQHPNSKSVPTGAKITRLKPQEVATYFSGKGMAEMCTVTVTTVELIPK